MAALRGGLDGDGAAAGVAAAPAAVTVVTGARGRRRSGRLGVLRDVAAQREVRGRVGRNEQGLTRVDQVGVRDGLVVLVVEPLPVGCLVVVVLGDPGQRVTGLDLVVRVARRASRRGVPRRRGAADEDGVRRVRVERRRRALPLPGARAPAAPRASAAATVPGLAAEVNACCACGAATSAPAIAIAGAALPAFSATFSTWEGAVCRPLRRIRTGRCSLHPAVILSPRLGALPGLRGR